MKYKLCRFCDQPVKPKGVKKLPDQYDHAQGCPYSRREWNWQGSQDKGNSMTRLPRKGGGG